MGKSFKEIRITGLDIEKTKPPLAASGLRRMYLKLSAGPPAEWRRIFQQDRSYPHHAKWQNARVEGSNIVVDCVPEEIDQYHLADLKEDVTNTNRKFLQWAAKQEAADK